MVWSAFLFTDYLSVTSLAQYAQDVIEWLLRTFRSCREVRGYVCNREHLFCTEIGFDRVGGILLPVLRKLLILTFNPIN